SRTGCFREPPGRGGHTRPTSTASAAGGRCGRAPWFYSFALSFLLTEVALQRSEDHVTKITTLLQGAYLRPLPDVLRHVQRRLHLALRLPVHHEEYSLPGFQDLLPARPHGDESLDPLGAIADLPGREAHDERQ